MRLALLGATVCALAQLAFATPAQADVSSAEPGVFVLRAEADVASSPRKAWNDLFAVDRWWNGAHSYSGDARKMSIDGRAGGCFCERWDGGSVEHGRVVMAFEHQGQRTLRINGALGPLQEMGVTGLLTFTVSAQSTGSKVVMTYRVSGDPGINLGQLAAPVDGVMMEQFRRLIRYTDTGAPA